MVSSKKMKGNGSLSRNRFVSLIFGLNIAVLGLRTESISSSLFD